jgi:hypothetical protein
MVQDRNLPEGTDKVIRGAATGPEDEPALEDRSGGEARGGGTVTADTTLVKEKKVPAPKGDAERPFAGSGTPQGGRVMEKLRSGGEKLSGQAADKARDLVSQGLERSGETLSNVSKLIGDTAAGLDERLGQEYGDYARKAAEAIENTAESLRSRDPDELIEDTRNFVRKSPGVALAGAAIVGFALARLVKSGLDAASRERDEDNNRGA